MPTRKRILPLLEAFEEWTTRPSSETPELGVAATKRGCADFVVEDVEVEVEVEGVDWAREKRSAAAVSEEGSPFANEATIGNEASVEESVSTLMRFGGG
jgi:hypothetical protein